MGARRAAARWACGVFRRCLRFPEFVAIPVTLLLAWRSARVRLRPSPRPFALAALLCAAASGLALALRQALRSRSPGDELRKTAAESPGPPHADRARFHEGLGILEPGQLKTTARKNDD